MPTTYAVPNGRTVFTPTLYTGDGTNGRTITNSGSFKPDLVWIKSRSDALNNNIYDSNRGAPKEISSNLTSAESDGDLTAFASNGFTINQTSGYEINHSGYTYAAWQWQAGQGTNTSNTAGSITSTVSVNQTSGFSIITWTGNGSAGATIGHGLGSTPAMIVIKSRSISGADWQVFHKYMNNGSSPWNYSLYFNGTNAQTSYTGLNNTAPTSTLITLGSNGGVNQNGSTYVAYCWSEVDGFSKFGYYTANGSTDGVFVYTGFRPAYVYIRHSSSVPAGGDSWTFDTQINPYNVSGNMMAVNTNSAQLTNNSYNNIDILSNGFKIRGNAGYDTNNSGTTYIYMAFAENPFKYANAR